MDNKTHWIAGALVAGAAFGCLLFYLSDDGEVAPSVLRALTRNKTLQILKDLKKEITPAFITLASFSLSIKEQTGHKISEEQIREILVTQSPIQQQLRRFEAKVYSAHSTTEQELKYAVEDLYSKDSEIRGIIEGLKHNLENAYRGKTPEVNSALPSFVTSDLILKCLTDMYDITKAVAFIRIEEMKEQGVDISPYNEQFLKGTQDMEIETEQEKQLIYERYGLTSTEDSPGILLHNALQQYSAADPAFVGGIAAIENSFKMTMQYIMQGTIQPAEQERLRALLSHKSL